MKLVSKSSLLAALLAVAATAGVGISSPATAANDCASADNPIRCERFSVATDLFKTCMTAGRKLSELKASDYEGRLDQVPGNEGELRFQNQKLGIAMRIQKKECTVFALSEKPADLIHLFDPIEEEIRQQYPKAAVRKRKNGTNWLAFEASENDERFVTAGKQKIGGQDFALLLYQFE